MQLGMVIEMGGLALGWEAEQGKIWASDGQQGRIGVRLAACAIVGGRWLVGWSSDRLFTIGCAEAYSRVTASVAGKLKRLN